MFARANGRQAALSGVLPLLAVAEFMLTLDLSIVNVALPAIRVDLDFTTDSLPWVVNAYALTFGGFLLLGGRAADLFGGRRVFLAALSVFCVASLACGMATDPGTLVVARAVQGLSAGVLSPATLSILTATYSEPNLRTRALSVWTAVAIGGGAVGALVGGVLTDVSSWRTIFFVNVPVGAVLLVLALTRLPRDRIAGAPRTPVDVVGAVTATTGLTALVWSLNRSEADGWASAKVLGGLALAGVLLALFVLVETRWVRVPLVPFAVFRSRMLWAGNLMSFMSFVPVMATWYFLSLYLQQAHDFTPTQTGAIFVPISLAVIGGSQVSFRVLPHTDARVLFCAGGLIAAVGMALLGALIARSALGWLILPACLTMAGGGLMFAPITVAATSGVTSEQAGLASGLLNTTRQVGGALGLAVLGTVAAAHAEDGVALSQTHSLTDGYAAGITVGAGIFVITAIAGALALPGRLTSRAEASLEEHTTDVG